MPLPAVAPPENVSGWLLHYARTDEETMDRLPHLIKYEYVWRFAVLDHDKAYFKIFYEDPSRKEEDATKSDDYAAVGGDNDDVDPYDAEIKEIKPRWISFLHNAKIMQLGRLTADEVGLDKEEHPHCLHGFQMTCLGKPLVGTGTERREYKVLLSTKSECSRWMHGLEKAVATVASVVEVEGRIVRPSRREVSRNWREGRVVIKGNATSMQVAKDEDLKASSLRKRRPSIELQEYVDPVDVKLHQSFGKSVTLHPVDHNWVVSDQNFKNTPAKPRIKTAAELIPNGIFAAIIKNDIDALIIYLSTHRAFDAMEGVEGDKLLHCACSVASVSLVTYFLDKGSDPNGFDGNGETPLYCAVKSRSTAIITLLRKKGADISLPSTEGVTPLSLACANGSRDVAIMLLDCGANPMTPDIRGITPFFTACAQGHVDIVRILIAMNDDIPGIVDINKTTNNDITPIYAACQRGNLEIIKLLVTLGAKFDEPSLQGITPFHAAVERGEIAVMQYLIELGSDPHACNSTNMTCLHTAVKFNKKEAVLLLVNACGLDVNAIDSYGKRPLDVAINSGHYELIEVIKGMGGIGGFDFTRDPRSRMMSRYRKESSGRVGDDKDSAGSVGKKSYSRGGAESKSNTPLGEADPRTKAWAQWSIDNAVPKDAVGEL